LLRGKVEFGLCELGLGLFEFFDELLDQLVPLFLQRLEFGQAFAKRQGDRGSRQGGERRRSGERFSHEEKTQCQSRYV
jgi:hypothetical protein